MSAGTPLWVDLLTPVVSLVGIVIAFLFGQVQGRSQARYVQSAEILTELRRLVLEIEMYAVDLPKNKHDQEGRAQLLQKIKEHELELVRYLETHALWLRRPVRDKVAAISNQFMDLADPVPWSEGVSPEALYIHAADAVSDVDADELKKQLRSLVIELAVETERLLGTGPPWWKPWLLTRKGRRKRYTSWEPPQS